MVDSIFAPFSIITSSKFSQVLLLSPVLVVVFVVVSDTPSIITSSYSDCVILDFVEVVILLAEWGVPVDGFGFSVFLEC